MGKLHILNGPDMGQSFKVLDGATYLGRSVENDIESGIKRFPGI